MGLNEWRGHVADTSHTSIQIDNVQHSDKPSADKMHRLRFVFVGLHKISIV